AWVVGVRTALMVAVCAAAGQTIAAQREPRAWTNILVIVLDDLGTDKLSMFDGNFAPPYPLTPRLDELAGSGIRFTNFYVDPYCSATRACLQTGRYSFHTGVGAR